MAKRTKIPKFRTDAEAAAFWDTHDSIKHISQTREEQLEFPKPRHKVVIDLGQRQWQILKYLANRKGISFNRLLKEFVSEKLVAS